MNWQKFFQAIMQTEETVLPVFIHSPGAQKIVGAILVAESIFRSVFGVVPSATPTTTATPPSA